MSGLTNRSTWLVNTGLRRLLAVAAVLALPACGSVGNDRPAVTKPTVPAETNLPQAPAAVPTTPVTSAPLGPPGAGAAGTGPIKVGLLLPLSGNGANVGTEMLNAAQMALFDLGEDRFVLLPRDTKGSPAGAAEAARQVVAEGARLLLGPLFSPEVAAVKPVAQGAGVSVLAFSNDWTRAGDGTFIMGWVPAYQVTRVVGFAQLRGLSRLAVLAPRDPYGDVVIAAARDAAQRHGVTIVHEERYGKDNAELAAAVARLAHGGSPTLEAEKRDLAGRTDEASRAALARLQAQATQDGSFDALLIGDGDRLKTLVPMLAANGIDSTRVRLLGTELWNDPAITRLPGLTGAWYAAPAPEARADFENRFDGLYHHRPQRLATLAYDAAALAGALTRNPATAGFDITSLTNTSGFSGVDGVFRLRADGMVEREMAVIEIGPDGPRVIDQAPTSFEALIN